MQKGKFSVQIALLSCLAVFLKTPYTFAEQLQEFTLDPVSITATRMEKNDLDVPNSVRVYTEQDIKNTGASNVLEAIKFNEGIIFNSQAPGGQSIGGMSSGITIRGMDSGTLVMLNGIPINLRGSFNLEMIPTDTIERIEVVRGNGAVLYGSAASGGVINIITKKSVTKSIDIAGGNQKRKRAGISWQEGKLDFNYSHTRYGDIKKYSKSKQWGNFDFSHKDSFMGTYRFDDNWSITHMTSRNRYSRWLDNVSDGKLYVDNDYSTYRRNTFLNYKDDTISASLYDNRRSLYNRTKYSSKASTKLANTGTKDSTTGIELQKRFDLSTGNIMTGFDVHKEAYSSADGLGGKKDFDRMHYSIFAQWHKPFTEKWEMDLGARYTWTGSTPGGNNYDNISPQLQFLYKADKDTSFYANVGRSFVMPTFSQIFGTAGNVIGNLDLEPQTGWQYDIGVKHIKGIHAWRASLFYMKIKDNISANTTDHSNVTYSNEDFKNIGFELSHDIKLDNGFSFTTGLTISRPQIKSGTGNWLDKYGRYQLNFGVGYNKDKWNASFMGNFLGKRRTGSVSTGTKKASPLFVTSLHLSYKPAKEHEIYFNMDNVFDRHAPQTHSSVGSYYYQTPRNFELGYKFYF